MLPFWPRDRETNYFVMLLDPKASSTRSRPAEDLLRACSHYMRVRVTFRKPAGKARRGSEAGRLATSCNEACGLSEGSPEGAGERRPQGGVAGSLLGTTQSRRPRLALRPALPRRVHAYSVNRP